MAGNVQMIIDGKHRRPRAVLLVTALVILVTGCGKKSGLEHAYSYDDRAVRFTAEDGDGRAPGFAAGLAVPKEGDDSPGEGEAALSARGWCGDYRYYSPGGAAYLRRRNGCGKNWQS